MLFDLILIIIYILIILRRVVVYSLCKPALEALYTILPPSDKYATKTFIDTVAFRIGDLGGSFYNFISYFLIKKDIIHAIIIFGYC